MSICFPIFVFGEVVLGECLGRIVQLTVHWPALLLKNFLSVCFVLVGLLLQQVVARRERVVHYFVERLLLFCLSQILPVDPPCVLLNAHWVQLKPEHTRFSVLHCPMQDHCIWLLSLGSSAIVDGRKKCCDQNFSTQNEFSASWVHLVDMEMSQEKWHLSSIQPSKLPPLMAESIKGLLCDIARNVMKLQILMLMINYQQPMLVIQWAQVIVRNWKWDGRHWEFWWALFSGETCLVKAYFW